LWILLRVGTRRLLLCATASNGLHGSPHLLEHHQRPLQPILCFALFLWFLALLPLWRGFVTFLPCNPVQFSSGVLAKSVSDTASTPTMANCVRPLWQLGQASAAPNSNEFVISDGLAQLGTQCYCNNSESPFHVGFVGIVFKTDVASTTYTDASSILDATDVAMILLHGSSSMSSSFIQMFSFSNPLRSVFCTVESILGKTATDYPRRASSGAAMQSEML
jgi:hypothetical protein